MTVTIADRARLDPKSLTLLAELEANRAALLRELARVPMNSAAANDRRLALAGTDRRIALLIRDRPAR